MPELDLTGLSHDEVGANAMMRLSQKRIRSPSPSSRATPEDEDAPRVARLHTAGMAASSSSRGNKNACGSDAARWADRAAKESAECQILQGCKCGCVFKHGLVMLDKVLEERELFATYTQKERRVHVKRYLFEHTCAARPLGFRMA